MHPSKSGMAGVVIDNNISHAAWLIRVREHIGKESILRAKGTRARPFRHSITFNEILNAVQCVLA